MTFNEQLKSVRLSKLDERGRTLSQEGAARLMIVSLSTYRNWEASPPRALPDIRSRARLQKLWPEMFSQP